MRTLAEKITHDSSLQTYWTIRLLVDKKLRPDCYRAYAYFRWLDDQIDIRCKSKPQRLKFITSQKNLIESCYQRKPTKVKFIEEDLLRELIKSNTNRKSKLGIFILNFFRIIEFDAYRKGRLISQRELFWYSKTLSLAVTCGIEHFINSGFHYPSSPLHYRAGIGAHLAHMLRDYREDLKEGYFNIPAEYLQKHHFQPTELNSPHLQSWVKSNCNRARQNLQLGRKYISTLPVWRGKLAATWYSVRFDNILSQIEKDNYFLRPLYPINNFTEILRFLWIGLSVTLGNL